MNNSGYAGGSAGRSDSLPAAYHSTQLIQVLKKQPANHPPNRFAGGMSDLGAGFVNATANLVEWLSVDPFVNLLKALGRTRDLLGIAGPLV